MEKSKWLKEKTLYNYLGQETLDEFAKLFPLEEVLVRFRVTEEGSRKGKEDFKIRTTARMVREEIKLIEQDGFFYCRDVIA